MSIRVLLFAGARDAVGRSEIEVDAAEVTARALLERVVQEHPSLAPYRNALRVAVNGAYAQWDEPVRAGDEVALIPPVAGG